MNTYASTNDVIYHNDEVQIVEFCCILHRIIVDASIELMRAESFSNESSQVNLSENSNGLETWKVETETETETSALETETRPRHLDVAPRRDRDKTMDRSRDGLETETSWSLAHPCLLLNVKQVNVLSGLLRHHSGILLQLISASLLLILPLTCRLTLSRESFYRHLKTHPLSHAYPP